MSDQAGDTPKMIRLGEGFHVRQAVDNIAWCDLGDDLVVVDALEEGHLEEEVFAAIESTCPGRPVRYVLNTHTHYDHVALNEAFVRRFQAQIVNQGTAPLPPQGRWFRGRLRKAHMMPSPGCHTSEDCVVFVEPDGVLFVGDIFGWGVIPLTVNFRAETLRLLEDTYRRLIGFGAATVVPGHGPLCTSAELQRWLDYLHALIDQVKALVRRGQDDADILQAVTPPDDMTGWWRFLKWKHADSVAKVLRGVRNGWL
jgi:cyclase